MDIQRNQTQESFEKLYVKNAPSWSLERETDGSYKYHATQSAFLLFEQQQVEIDLLKAKLAKAQAVLEPNALLSASLDAIQKLGSGDFVLVPRVPTEEMIQIGTKANSECLNENAPLGERLYRHPTIQVYTAMVAGLEKSHD